MLRTQNLLKFVFLLAICVGVASAQDSDDTDYLIGSGDVIRIEIGGEVALSGTYPVSDQGTIIFPLLGAVTVAGSTSKAITHALTKSLGDDFLVRPQVAVYIDVYGSKKVSVLGNVPHPGFYHLKRDTTLLSLLADAGVNLVENDTKVIVAKQPVRDPKTQVETVPTPKIVDLKTLLNPWHEAESIQLTDGDRVFVQNESAGKIVISGRIKNPGILPLTESLTVLEAVNQAGGVAEYGNASAVRVIRQTRDGAENIAVDLTAILDGDRSLDIQLLDGDIVIVPRRWF